MHQPKKFENEPMEYIGNIKILLNKKLDQSVVLGVDFLYDT